jgi:hypothetical protein
MINVLAIAAAVNISLFTGPPNALVFPEDEQGRAAARVYFCMKTVNGNPNCSPAQQVSAFEEALRLNASKSPKGKADWAAWKIAHANEAHSLSEAMALYVREQERQGSDHSSLSTHYLSGQCNPDRTDLWMYGSEDKDEVCDRARHQFQRNYWLALQGDYVAQTDVAACFDAELALNPCVGTVLSSSTEFCAWLLVALSSRSTEIDPLEVVNYRDICETRSYSEKRAFRARAFQLFSHIYHKPTSASRPTGQTHP